MADHDSDAADGASSTDCFLDQDGDGVGSGAPIPCPEARLDASVDPVDGGDAGEDALKGIARVGGDCDDLSTARAPGFVEACDDVDNDCDGEVNEGFDVGTACEGVGACGKGVVECASLTATRCSTDPDGTQDQSADDEASCDGKDEDCDGEVDENWNVGKACDGAGLCGLGVLECATTDAARCSTGPGGSASEVVAEECDGLDNDCDGVADNGLTVRTYYADCDRDTFGAGAAFSGCKPPSGSCPFATNNKDCADTNANMKPGQTGYFSTAANMSFDYNCDKKIEKQYVRTAKECDGDLACLAAPHWEGSTVPACGAIGSYCDILFGDGCKDTKQACR